MRPLMFGWEFPPHISGGLGTACYGLTQALAESGEEVVFVLPRVRQEKGESHVKLISASDVSRATEMKRRRFRLIDFREVDALLGPYFTEERYREVRRHLQEQQTSGQQRREGTGLSGLYGNNLLDEVVRYSEIADVIAKKERFDVIHAHDWMTVLAGIRAKRASRKPLVYHVHALEFDRSGETVNPSIYDIERYGMEKADHIIAVSQYTKDMITQRYGISPEKVTVVYNAVLQADKIRRREQSRRKIVLFLGRITFQKGPDYFVEAASRVLQIMPEVLFVMAGTGDMVERMIARVAQLGIGMNFHFTGFLREPEVERIYGMSDLYVMPSVSEPFGISPLEAIRHDVPVIISRQSGVSEILKSALKVDFWDTEALAGKILAVLSFQALKRDLLEGHREELKAVQWQSAALKVIQIYRALLGKA